jgi:flavin reductase (DIM6/NTAB) family NADH-FMN oxidoreductase RutF
MKRRLGPTVFVYPMPTVLAGALVDGRPNFTTLGNNGLMRVEPPTTYVSIYEGHYSAKGIREHGTFSVNYPSADQMVVADRCGLISGRDVDKPQWFDVFYGELGTAPMISECPASLECQVIETVSLGHMTVFIGEIVEVYVDEDIAGKEGKPASYADMERLDPLIYCPGNAYHRLGERIGRGFHEAKREEANVV